MSLFINKPKFLDQPFEADYLGKQFFLYARTEKAARQKAIEHLRLKQKDAENLFVMPLE